MTNTPDNSEKRSVEDYAALVGSDTEDPLKLSREERLAADEHPGGSEFLPDAKQLLSRKANLNPLVPGDTTPEATADRVLDERRHTIIDNNDPP